MNPPNLHSITNPRANRSVTARLWLASCIACAGVALAVADVDAADGNDRGAPATFTADDGGGARPAGVDEMVTDASRLEILRPEVVEHGRRLFGRPWQQDDGVGPVMNAASCSACHNHRALGGGGLSFANPRIAHNPKTGQTFSYKESMREAEPPFGWIIVERNAPWLQGIGFKDAILEKTIAAGEDPEDLNGDGIRGRFVARHGWKGRLPDATVFAAEALRDELGLTTSVFPWDPYNPGGDAQEVSDEELHAIVAFMYALEPPNRVEIYEGDVIAGYAAFVDVGCNKCHVESLPIVQTFEFPTVDPVIRIVASPEDPVDVFLFSDLLVHEMGPSLADVPRSGIGAGEFRTRDLWGMYQNRGLLHNGSLNDIGASIEAHWDPELDPDRISTAADSIEAYRLLDETTKTNMKVFLESMRFDVEPF